MPVWAQTTSTVSVTFSPTVAGTRPGSVTLSDNSVGSPEQSIALTGTGEVMNGVTFEALREHGSVRLNLPSPHLPFRQGTKVSPDRNNSNFGPSQNDGQVDGAHGGFDSHT